MGPSVGLVMGVVDVAGSSVGGSEPSKPLESRFVPLKACCDGGAGCFSLMVSPNQCLHFSIPHRLRDYVDENQK